VKYCLRDLIICSVINLFYKSESYVLVIVWYLLKNVSNNYRSCKIFDEILSVNSLLLFLYSKLVFFQFIYWIYKYFFITSGIYVTD